MSVLRQKHTSSILMLFPEHKAEVMLGHKDGFPLLSKHSDYIINTGNHPSLFLSEAGLFFFSFKILL